MATKEPNKKISEIKERKSLKDTTHFAIITTIFVPLLVALIGLAGIIVPKLIDKSSESASANGQTSQSPLSNNVAKNTVTTAGQQSIIGYASHENIIAYVKSTAHDIVLNPKAGPDDYNIEIEGGEYYLIGYSKENPDIGNIYLVSSTNKDYPLKLKINFKDIKTISFQDKNGKNKVAGLLIDALKIANI